MIRVIATMIGRVAAFLLPGPLRQWGRAMQAEIALIDDPLSALRFALGCLGCACRQAAYRTLLRPAAEPFVLAGKVLAQRKELSMNGWIMLPYRPQRIAALCAASAVGLGMAYMALAGAPMRHLAVNGVALLLGLVMLAFLGRTRVNGLLSGAATIGFAIALLLTGLFGFSADGVTRWIVVGGVALQPSLILLPVLVLFFAQRRDALSTIAMLIAAFALALQPDRAMAGALFMAMAALAWIYPERNVHIALLAALTGLIVALVSPDNAPAVAYVDRIFYSSFDVSALAGLAVVTGAVLMVVPAFAGWWRDPAHRPMHLVFGLFWFAVIVAALVGNYPTPLVGYGGSAILGYLISLTRLPSSAAVAQVTAVHTGSEERDDPEMRLHFAL